jgi:hypothetical protein
MNLRLSWTLALPLLAATALPAPAQEKAARAPIEGRLVATKDTYTLDLGGLSADDFRKRLQDSVARGPGITPPKVELSLELVNTSDKDLEVQVEGTRNVLTLDLKGPGAESVKFKRLQPRFIKASRIVKLAPGKSVKVPITSLAYGLRGLTDAAYWTAPGDYMIRASYQTAIRPAPTGTRDIGSGFGGVTVSTAPVKLKVEAK